MSPTPVVIENKPEDDSQMNQAAGDQVKQVNQKLAEMQIAESQNKGADNGKTEENKEENVDDEAGPSPKDNIEEEPLLCPNPRRFVMFPIEYEEIWYMYKKVIIFPNFLQKLMNLYDSMKLPSGLLKKSTCLETWMTGNTS